MDMDWSKDGKVTASMIKYLFQILNEFIDEITKTSVTLSANYLFKICKNCDAAQLPEELALICHHTVAQPLFVSQRAQRDVQTPVSFLTKRVKAPDRGN